MARTIKFAFLQTIPVMLGYVFLGMAFGLLLQRAGYNALWAFCISTFVFAGSMQFVLIGFLSGGVSLITAALMTLSVNSRHLFYGLSFIEKFKSMGKKGWYMIFSLSDETYSLLCGTNVPKELDENKALFFIALLNQGYWVLGSVAGSLLGALITINTTGIDFAMTALFVVIFVEQWYAAKSHLPAVIGFLCGVFCLLVFGVNQFILPSLILAVGLLLLLKKTIAKGVETACK